MDPRIVTRWSKEAEKESVKRKCLKEEEECKF